MTSGLHTYAHYIRYDCDALLSKPEYQKDLARLEIFTLAKDIAAEDDFLPTEEDTSCLNPDYGFFVTNSCYMLVEEELIEFEIGQMGVKALKRGCAGTKAVAHKKGVKVEHLSGLFNMLQPVSGSNLFYEVARLTAKAYNEGGFKMIYLDALDGIYHQSQNDDEIFYYCASFVHEIFKYVEVDPLIEYSCLPASLWIARGRNGAWDNAFRGYKEFNRRHAQAGQISKDCFMASTLGWFHYYPLTDNYPGNEHTKYLFTDAVEHMGSLAIMHDLSTVFSFAIKANLERWIGMRRNIATYRKYDDLRKAQYFSEAYRQKLIDGKWEYHLVQKRGGKWRFVEKHYEREKLHDLGDAQRNTAEYTNPFRAQVPFVRIEALLSTKLQNPFVMLPLDEHRDLTEQVCECDFGREVDLSDKLAKHVRVLGNGKKGGKIAIKTRCATRSEHGYGEYIIDTDFEGWRDFVIVESDNGERRDHHFEDKEKFMATYRSGLNSNRITKISLEFEGDLTGVRMTSVIAYEHTYEMLKNPTVKVGDTQVMFECELLSSDYIEFDGKEAFVYDRHGNAKKIWFESNLAVPKGKFTASLTARALNRTTPRAILTFGYTGKEIKE